MLNDLETVALRKRQESELKVSRLSLAVTMMDGIRSENIRGTAHVKCFGDKTKEVRWRWFGHAQKRNSECTGKRMLRLPGRRLWEML